MNVTDTSPTSVTDVESHVILRWDTTSIPDSLIAVESWLRLHVVSTGVSSSTTAADRSLRGDWYAGPADYCAESDYDSGDADALSTALTCGAQCDLANVIIGMDNDFALSDSVTPIDSGSPALRLWAPNGGAAVANHLFAAASGWTVAGPRLVVLACARPPTPTPTVTPTITPTPFGCDYFVAAATAAQSTVAVSLADDGAGVAMVHRRQRRRAAGGPCGARGSGRSLPDGGVEPAGALGCAAATARIRDHRCLAARTCRRRGQRRRCGHRRRLADLDDLWVDRSYQCRPVRGPLRRRQMRRSVCAGERQHGHRRRSAARRRQRPHPGDGRAVAPPQHLYIHLPPWIDISTGANSLLRWDTSALPADAVVTGTELRAVVVTAMTTSQPA